MLRKLSLLAVLALSCQSSYSESISPYYGSTGNAAALGHSWVMDNVLPEPPGLDINSVIYNYTIQKEVQDRVDVHVQNENAQGPGYIFRETDSWMPGSLGGTEINKVVPVIPNIPRQAWGDGSIEVDGPGSVTDANVVYTYKVDPCYDPQFDPNCPGYRVPMPDIPEIDVSTLYNVMDDENIELNRETDTEQYEEQEEKDTKEQDEEEEKDSKERLEKALAAADNSAMFAQALAQSQMLATMNMAMNMSSYYAQTIPGGTYKETTVLVDKELPENKKGLRNGLAQQLLHQQMVDMQY